jgi:hypothetical protein
LGRKPAGQRKPFLFSFAGLYKFEINWRVIFITLTLSSIWAYWGAIENFHEGWYSTSIWENLFMLFFQYLLFTIIFVSLAVIILKWKKIGLILHFIVAAVSVWFFSGASFSVIGLMIVIPIIALGLVYYYGEPKPKKWTYRLLISIPQGIKVSQRINDNDFGERIVQGNGVTLA